MAATSIVAGGAWRPQPVVRPAVRSAPSARRSIRATFATEAPRRLATRLRESPRVP